MQIVQNNLKESISNDQQKQNSASPSTIATRIAASGRFITGSDEQLRFYNKDSNIWEVVPQNHPVNMEIFESLGTKFSRGKERDTIRALSILTNIGQLNKGARDELITLKNGVLDVNSMELLPHDMDLHNCYSLSVNYDENARCPNWISFLNSVFSGDKDSAEKIECLQQYTGLCMTTDMKYQKALFLSGNGANGKGVFLEIIRSILQPASVNMSLKDLYDPTATVNMIGKTLAYDGDITKKGGVDDGVFKKAVAGEEIRMKTLYKNPIAAKPTCKFLIAGNSLPHTKDTSKGYFRRWIIIKFGESFIGREDRNLVDKLRGEVDGIFNWMVEGLKQLREQGYITEPVSSGYELGEYNNVASSVYSFHNEVLQEIPGHEVRGKELYEAYIKHCEFSRLRPLSKQSFFKEFEDKFEEVKMGLDSNKCKIFKNVEIVTEGHSPDVPF